MGEYPETGEFVIPGEKLSLIEAYMPGKNSYVEDGYIYAEKIGNVLKDVKKRQIWVYPRVEKPILINVGDILLGQIVQIKEKSATVKLFYKIKPRKALFKTPYTGEIYIANAKRQYLTNLFETFTVGDIVKCMVTKKTSYMTALSTQAPNLGVVYSTCTNCHAELRLKTVRRGRILYCPKCGKEYIGKKVADDYGRIIILQKG